MSSNALTISRSSLEKSVMINEETNSEANESEDHPASRKEVAEIVEIDGTIDINTPGDFSDDEDNDPAAIALNKQTLLEWVTVADFTQDM